ncbi:MAG TPA: alpha/beta fold hydrolase [Acidimicrobiia bacterium]|nr:alpha/beta fold hydrolase [Acidimicrobiia bacterium]
MATGPSPPGPFQGLLPVGGAGLFYRHIGRGHPILVLHGGPDFDHNYLLPEMDRLAASFHLIYHDQRGRGRSAPGVEPEDVTIDSDVSDLDELRRHFGLDSMAILGHSWGGILAMEYAVRHPGRVSHLILMNSAPASFDDRLLFREHLLGLRPPGDVERMQQLSESPEFKSGSIEVETEYYLTHFRVALPRPELVEQVVGRLRSHFSEETVLIARAIEHRLYEQTWLRPGYDLPRELSRHPVPTLVIHGDQDFVPVELVSHIAEALPGSHFVVIPDCGHFAFLEHPDLVFEHIAAFIGGR